ncbi:alpha- and gamma-adaptin-binding protein p34 isoform X1 [Chamaea fasciata]
MAAAGRPLALLTSCAAGFAPEELVKRITGRDDLTVGAITSGRVNFYPWTIDNKYYSADIHLCVVPNTFHVTGEIAEAVQAFIVYFDSTTKTGLEGVSEWLPLTEEWLPEVLILVCDRVSDNGVNRQKAQEWCIKHGFELVELSPEELPDEDDDFPESTGVKRIVQALNANVWSNVVMKGDRTQGFGLLSTLAGANRSRGCEETPETESNPSPGDREESQLDGGEDGAGTNSLEPDSAAAFQEMGFPYQLRVRSECVLWSHHSCIHSVAVSGQIILESARNLQYWMSSYVMCHRIMESGIFGVRRDLKLIPSHGQGHLPLSQAAPSPNVQPGLGHFQGWDSHGFSGKMCQGLPSLAGRNFFHKINQPSNNPIICLSEQSVN